MKTYSENTTKYYKYSYTPFTQPQLSSDGVMGGSTMAVSSSRGAGVWQCFKPNGGTVGFYVDEGYGEMWIRMYYPKPVRLDKIGFNVYSGHSASSGAYNIRLYSGMFAGQQSEVQWFANIGEGGALNANVAPMNRCYQYYDLWMGNGGHSYEDELIIYNIWADGAYQDVVETTKSEAEWSVTDYNTSLIAEPNERKYYKYVYESWTQPTLSADGVVGGNNFACFSSGTYGNNSSYAAWKAFDRNSTASGEYDKWTSPETSDTKYIGFYNPQPLKVTKLRIYNHITYSNYYLVSGTIQGSNDRLSWTDLSEFSNGTNVNYFDVNLNSNNNYYKYYRITNLLGSLGAQHEVWVREIDITATQRSTIESTSSNYDFYKDTYKYYALKSWEKGQYYGGNN